MARNGKVVIELSSSAAREVKRVITDCAVFENDKRTGRILSNFSKQIEKSLRGEEADNER
ncbi:MAG: hypothetical protein A4E57_00006 [Syntrophorhabdaceae bacterium PtaU1.Bin034]|nr:MAG: hypothetical protein A4E57_00006 [Syntrophorhabdaceae bacterium PtaU1.Bin034]